MKQSWNWSSWNVGSFQTARHISTRSIRWTLRSYDTKDGRQIRVWTLKPCDGTTMLFHFIDCAEPRLWSQALVQEVIQRPAAHLWHTSQKQNKQTEHGKRESGWSTQIRVSTFAWRLHNTFWRVRQTDRKCQPADTALRYWETSKVLAPLTNKGFASLKIRNTGFIYVARTVLSLCPYPRECLLPVCSFYDTLKWIGNLTYSAATELHWQIILSKFKANVFYGMELNISLRTQYHDWNLLEAVTYKLNMIF